MSWKMFGLGKVQILHCVMQLNILIILEMLDSIILFISNLITIYTHSINIYCYIKTICDSLKEKFHLLSNSFNYQHILVYRSVSINKHINCLLHQSLCYKLGVQRCIYSQRTNWKRRPIWLKNKYKFIFVAVKNNY